MAEPYIGEIRMFAGNFAPQGWLFCDGRTLAANDPDYSQLFQVIGTTYGGDGNSQFALPDLRSRVPVSMGTGSGLSTYTLGDAGGAETVTVREQELPRHIHGAFAQNTQGSQTNPVNGVWAASNLGQYSSNVANATMNLQSMSATGGNQPHNNMLPFQAINYIISLYGIYPTPN